MLAFTIDPLSYSIASGIPVALTIVKCWNINHQNNRYTYSHESLGQNDKCTKYYTLYNFDDWYFSTWQSSMPLEFHWQLINWVHMYNISKEDSESYAPDQSFESQ